MTKGLGRGGREIVMGEKSLVWRLAGLEVDEV